MVDHLVALRRATLATCLVACASAPAEAQPRYALASYTAAERGGEPYPLVAVGLTVGLAWIPIVGPAVGYTYAGEPIRGAWVGIGQLTASGAGWGAGYLVGALLAPYTTPAGPREAPAAAAQRAADLGGAYGALAALLAYTAWTAFDVHRLAAANADGRGL